MTVTYVIWGITAGMCVAAVYFYFIKKACGGFIKALTDNGCVGEENAKNADEMGISPISGYIKKQISENGGMHTMVKTTADGKYYIPEERVLMANKKYRNETLPFAAVLALVLLIAAVGGVVGYYAPTILDAAGDLF